MNSFRLIDDGIIGNPEDIKKLSSLEEANILIISDSHGNTANLYRILKDFGSFCHALIFCGDGVYDLGMLIDSVFAGKSEAPILPPVIVLVQGNGDPSSITSDFPPHLIDIPKSAVIKAAGKNIYITHGHIQNVYYGDSMLKEFADEAGCPVILHGHTHVARQTYLNGSHIICPGSISLPRGGTEKSFCVLTIKGSYIDAAFKKITPAGFESFSPAGF